MEATIETTGEQADGWKAAADASAEIEADRVQTRNYETVLDVKLDEPTLIEMGASMARALGQREAVKAEKKAADAGFTARISELDTQLEALGAKVRAGVDHTLVPVREDRIFRTGVIRVTRLVTGEIVAERPMSAGERQLTLPKSDEAGYEQTVADEERGELFGGEPAEITDPAAVLGDEPEQPKRQRGRRGGR